MRGLSSQWGSENGDSGTSLRGEGEGSGNRLRYVLKGEGSIDPKLATLGASQEI